MKVALYASNHGFGHASRISALAQSFIEFGIFVYLCTDRPQFLFQGLDPQFVVYRETKIDRGVVHKENLISDLPATKAALLELFSKREELVAQEVDFLRDSGIDLVISDIPYLIVEACGFANIPIFGISNFDWYFVYHELFNTDEDLVPVLNTIWALYHRMDKTYLLDLGSRESVPGFKEPTEGGLVSRTKNAFKDIHNQYNINKEQKILLLMFGGEGKISLPIKEICEAWDGVVISPYHHESIPRLINVPQDEDFLSLIHFSDLIICKPGYSTFAEILTMGKSMLYIPRKNYPEERVLIEGVKHYPNALMVEDFPNQVGEIRKLFATISKTDYKWEASNSFIVGDMLNEWIKIQFPKDRILSIFDLGSNNMNYLLYNKSRSMVIHRFWCTTGLARGFNNGMLADQSMHCAILSMNKLLMKDKHIESHKRLIATGISRKAKNAAKFIESLSNSFQIKAKTISAMEELKYSWLAAQEYMQPTQDNVVIDIGGSSTEISWEQIDGEPTGVSLDMGLISLLDEENLGNDIIAIIDTGYSKLPQFNKLRLIVVGLTATMLLHYIRSVPIKQSNDLAPNITLKELDDFLLRISNSTHAKHKEKADNNWEISSMRIAAQIIKLLLDRYEGLDFVVCNNGISMGYAKWIK